MSQTSYTDTPPIALPGMKYGTDRTMDRSALNNSGATVPFGVGVKQGSSNDDAAVPPTASSDKIIGISLRAYSQNNYGLGTTVTGIQDADRFGIMQRGKVYVQVEQAVSAGDQPYCRFATSLNDGTLTQKGSWRKDADLNGAVSGTANVVTGTPTAVNSTEYVLRVEYGSKSWAFEYLSDGSATATEIVTGFKTLMAADAEFTALIVATGTTTLILTAQDKTSAITAQSEGDGAIAVANTTPYVAPSAGTASALLVKGARFETSASAAGFACLSFDVNAAAA